jgi:short-subunit dehydrogenase
LAKRGAHVVLAARRADVLQDVKSLIISETPTARVECMPLKLTNLQSVRQFAEEYKQKKMPLNILM